MCVYVPRSNTPMLQASSKAVPLCILCKWLERPPVVIIKVSHSNNLQGRPWQLQPWRGCCRSQSCFSRSWRSTRNTRPRDSEHRKHISSNTIQDTSWSINGSNILASGKFEVVKSNSTWMPRHGSRHHNFKHFDYHAPFCRSCIQNLWNVSESIAKKVSN